VTLHSLSQDTEHEITVRDARSAVLVQKLFDDKYRTLARDSPVRAMGHMAQPTSVIDLKLHPLSVPASVYHRRAANASRLLLEEEKKPKEQEEQSIRT
jgi:hypothetical protein